MGSSLYIFYCPVKRGSNYTYVYYKYESTFIQILIYESGLGQAGQIVMRFDIGSDYIVE